MLAAGKQDFSFFDKRVWAAGKKYGTYGSTYCKHTACFLDGVAQTKEYVTMECERLQRLVKSWYAQVQEESMAPARMVSFMERHIAECAFCLADPLVRQDIAKITAIILPPPKIRKPTAEEDDALAAGPEEASDTSTGEDLPGDDAATEDEEADDDVETLEDELEDDDLEDDE